MEKPSTDGEFLICFLYYVRHANQSIIYGCSVRRYTTLIYLGGSINAIINLTIINNIVNLYRQPHNSTWLVDICVHNYVDSSFVRECHFRVSDLNKLEVISDVVNSKVAPR